MNVKFVALLFFCISVLLFATDENAANASFFFTDGSISVKKGTAFFSNGTLRRYFDESERFLSDSTYMNTLRCADDLLVQKKFDSSYRVIQKTVWKPSFPFPVRQTDYFYFEDSPFPERAEISDRENGHVIYEFYGEKGLPVKRVTYENPAETVALFEKDAAAEQNAVIGGTDANPDSVSQKKTLCSETIAYDSEGRITEHLAVYPDAESDKKNEKTEYRYRKGGVKADIFFYTDGKKTKQKVYFSAKDWEETLFFPNNIKIVTVYKNESPVSEIFYEGELKKRERTL